MVVGAVAVVLKRRSSPKSEMSERGDSDRLCLWKIGAMSKSRGGTSSWGNVMELLFGELLGDGF